jgi:sulfite reductase beta subunit-like hemoprotein
MTAPAEINTEHTPEAITAEIDKFEVALEEYLDGTLEEETFRVVRLTNGIYGQRQGGTNQMVRVKIPHGRLTPRQLEVLGDIATEFSRGWGHITTRQNVQLHFVELRRVPELMRRLAAAGMTTREACGDTVRNVAGCHLAGACPYEVVDITPWAQATTELFLRNPIAQRLPRKFKINFSGCVTDCGQAMFNDIGVVGISRPLEDGSLEPGFRVMFAGGLGTTPHEAQVLEDFTSREDLMVTLEAILRVFDRHGNRDNKLRARMKWLVDTMGIDELRARILKERRLLRSSVTYFRGLPPAVARMGDQPAGVSTRISPTKVGSPVPVTILSVDPRKRWEDANVVRGIAREKVSAYAFCRLGDITTAQFYGVAAIARDFGLDVRVTNRQNFVFRELSEDQLPLLYDRLAALDMDRPGAELARDVVACPGADTCNLAVTQSRGLADDIGRALEEAGLAEVPGVRVNISGCSNSCGQHHIADIGFMGLERRAHGQSAPGYQMLLGGQIGHLQVHFGDKATKLPAKKTGQAVVRLVGRFARERSAGESFASWLERSGGAAEVGASLKDLDVFETPEQRPDLYVDFDETGPYEKSIGQSECAT